MKTNLGSNDLTGKTRKDDKRSLQLFVRHTDKTAGCATGQKQMGAGEKSMNVSR